MRNADEHKKLLAQIAELEKNSVNYFDVEKEFFLIDSDNLAEVKTRLYGYSIQATGIYEQNNLTEDAVKNLDGRGCYVYVEARDGHITIKQDLNGCWGIYLFRHRDYFALSNSFFRLLNHIKFKYPLTVNRDYCNYLLINGLCSHAHLETAVNEVRLIERNAILHIDTTKKNLEIELIDYREHTVPLDSEEGIAVLDRWVEFWSSVLRGVAQNTQFISADLTGGFDSRIAFIVALHSGIAPDKIQIHSIKGTLHTYKDDYEIASQIVEHYNFKLNQSLPQNPSLKLSFSNAWNCYFYNMQTFHKSFMFSTQKPVNKCYKLTGYGGETIRTYWQKSPRKYLEGQKWRTNSYSSLLSRELFHSLETLIQSAFHSIREKYNIADENCEDIPQYLYQETRCRHHFGKFSLHHYFKGNILLSPILDPELRTLQLNTSECLDTNLLMSLILARFEPDLLQFPFDSKRFIAPETISYAKNLNAHFPICRKKADNLNGGGQPFHLQPRDLQVEKILADGKNNPNLPSGMTGACLKAIFESSRTYGLFTTYFDEELYRYAANYYDNQVFNRFNYMTGVVGVAKTLEDVEISQRNHSPYQDMQRFLEQDFCQIVDGNAAQEVNSENYNAQIIDNFKRYFTARIDIQLKPTTQGDFEVVSVSDDKAKVSKPAWFQKNGVGYVITSYVGNLELVTKATADGQLRLNLKGLWIPSPEDRSKLIPYWIDYTKLTVNGNVIFDTLTPAWHDKPYSYRLEVKANDEIKIQVEWLPHRSDA